MSLPILLIKRIPKEPLHAWFDKVLVEIFKVKGKPQFRKRQQVKDELN